MVSLAFLMETGSQVPKDVPGALALFAKAAERGNIDAAIDLGYALAKGEGVARDMTRAVQLFRSASRAGSAVATYDLARMIDDGVGPGKPAEALTLYKQAAAMGFPRAHLGAAILLDLGRGVARNPSAAAEELLACAREDDGECMTALTSATQRRSPDAIKALQARLRAAGYYAGPIDGRAGQGLAPALEQWRLLGPP
jgi:TPR repeat protein